MMPLLYAVACAFDDPTAETPGATGAAALGFRHAITGNDKGRRHLQLDPDKASGRNLIARRAPGH